MGKKRFWLAELAALCLAALLAAAAHAEVTISGLSPNNRWFHTPAVETGMVTLSAAAPSGGAVIVLSSSNPEIVVPSTVTVPAGRTSANFPINGASYNSRGEGDVTAMYGGTSKSIHLQIDPGSDVRSVSVDRAIVAAGSSVTFRVELCGAAPAGGVSVPLFKSGPGQAYISLPVTLTVPAGQTTAETTVATSAVQAATSATLCANSPTAEWAMMGCVGNSSKTSVVVSPNGEMPLKGVLAMGKYTLSFSSAAATGAGWGINFKVSIPFSVDAPVTVPVSSSDPTIAPIPPAITIDPRKTEGSVYFFTNAVTATTTVRLTASLGGISKAVPVEVRKEAVVQSLSLSPESAGSNPVVTGMVTLDQPAPQKGTNVRLSSSDPGLATVPASLLIAEGSTKGTFNIAVSATAAQATVTIGAEFAGKRTTASLSVGQAPLTAGLKESSISAKRFSQADMASTIIIGRWAGDFERLSKAPDFTKRAQGSRDTKEYLAQAQARCDSMRLEVAKDTISLRMVEQGRIVSVLSGKYEILKDAPTSVTVRVTPGTLKGVASKASLIKGAGDRTVVLVLSDRNHLRLRVGNGPWDYLKRLDRAPDPRE
ncbi:MAG: hypothetical protein A2Y86_06025 [Candidatus Aminicenantes bacterium RBG_13_62_12]|nr:MAG: hypothetical protein A2Y86_06025 [Candidatus Aminicenantes bacterium RBG_13_62_12]